MLNPQKEQGPASILRTVGTEMKPTHGYGNGTRTVLQQSGRVHTDDILNINVGGKKYTVNWQRGKIDRVHTLVFGQYLKEAIANSGRRYIILKP